MQKFHPVFFTTLSKLKKISAYSVILSPIEGTFFQKKERIIIGKQIFSLLDGHSIRFCQERQNSTLWGIMRHPFQIEEQQQH